MSAIIQLRPTSRQVDESVRRAVRENGTIYAIDEPLLRQLRPHVVLTQKLCDVCAVGYGTVARLAETLPGPPRVVNLEPSSLSDIFNDIRRVAQACGVVDRPDEVIAKLSARVEAVRDRASQTTHRPRCFFMEWVDPPFCSGHWGPELVEIAGGQDPLGRKYQPSVQIDWNAVLDARPEVIVLALCGVFVLMVLAVHFVSVAVLVSWAIAARCACLLAAKASARAAGGPRSRTASRWLAVRSDRGAGTSLALAAHLRPSRQ